MNERLKELLVELLMVAKDLKGPGRWFLKARKFRFAPGITWSPSPDIGLRYVKVDHRFIDLESAKERDDLVREIVERNGEDPLGEIEKAILWCRKEKERIEEVQRRILQRQKKAFEEIKARACLLALAGGQEETGLYGMYESVIVSLLRELIGEVKGFMESGMFFLTLKKFYFACGVRWPAGKGNGFYYVSTEQGFMYLDSARDQKLLARIIIDKGRGEPEKILKAIREIEKAILWCRKEKERTKEIVRRFLQQQKKAVEEIKAKAWKIPLQTGETWFYKMCRLFVISLLADLLSAVEDLEKTRGLPFRVKKFCFAPGITWPAKVGQKFDFYSVHDEGECFWGFASLEYQERKKILAWRIVEESRGEPEKILKSIREMEKAILWCREEKARYWEVLFTLSKLKEAIDELLEVDSSLPHGPSLRVPRIRIAPGITWPGNTFPPFHLYCFRDEKKNELIDVRNAEGRDLLALKILARSGRKQVHGIKIVLQYCEREKEKILQSRGGK
ncbi:MAG: hypothetical protein QXH03_00345 [Candidatus Bathyarchaeia archaeon]